MVNVTRKTETRVCYILAADRSTLSTVNACSHLLRHFSSSQPRIQGVTCFFFWRKSGRSVNMTTHLHLAPKLGTKVAKLLFPLFESMAWRGSTCSKCMKNWYLIRWGKFSQKHNYGYMAKWWCLLAIENYMFRPVAIIIRFWQLYI